MGQSESGTLALHKSRTRRFHEGIRLYRNGSVLYTPQKFPVYCVKMRL